MKERAMFAVEVLVVIGLIALVQKKFMNVPVVGEFLPGFTAR